MSHSNSWLNHSLSDTTNTNITEDLYVLFCSLIWYCKDKKWNWKQTNWGTGVYIDFDLDLWAEKTKDSIEVTRDNFFQQTTWEIWQRTTEVQSMHIFCFNQLMNQRWNKSALFGLICYTLKSKFRGPKVTWISWCHERPKGLENLMKSERLGDKKLIEKIELTQTITPTQ